MRLMLSRTASATELGALYTSMFSLWLTERGRSITTIGSASREWLSLAATTDFAPCFSSWRPPTRRSERRSIRERVGMTPCGIGAIIHWNGRAFDVCHICGGRTTGCEIL